MNCAGVAAELTTALENSVRGQAVDLRRTLNNCAEIFPELFNSIASTNIATCRLKVSKLTYIISATQCLVIDESS